MERIDELKKQKRELESQIAAVQNEICDIEANLANAELKDIYEKTKDKYIKFTTSSSINLGKVTGYGPITWDGSHNIIISKLVRIWRNGVGDWKNGEFDLRDVFAFTIGVKSLLEGEIEIISKDEYMKIARNTMDEFLR